ncbi:MAG: DUF3592 domain-containing protein [Anaerolineaceae bacterium]|nr:DUF3592 domain-containing protein [Anaerolineaceae bacterium]
MMTWAIVLWVVALAFILVTLKNIIVRAVKTRRCTAAVTATIVDVKEKTRTQGRSGDHAGITTTEYLPTVSYMVNGVEYSKPFAKAYHADTYAIGQTVEIMVNPNKPSEINKLGKSNKADLVMLTIGVLIGVAGAVLLMVA